jgi:poly(hydroxyalkanoate) depolymerase family esterase
MMEATRLTREGRLDEAMAVLQGKQHAAPPSATDVLPPRSQPRAALLDMLPPDAAGGAWSAPPTGAEAPARTPDGPAAAMPQVLRGLMNRMGTPGGAQSTAPGLAEMLRSKLGGGLGASSPVVIPDGARFEEHVHVGPAGSRPYKIYVPSTFTGEALPLVVMLHGCTQSPDDFAAGTRMNDLAEEFGLLVAYPGQTQAANMQKCWNWFNAADQQRGRGEPALIAGITRDAMERLPVEPARVYVAGLSAGGAKAAIMGTAYPDLYAAVGVHSGLACGAARDMPGAFAAMRQGGGATLPAGQPVPTIVFHGDRDSTVHPVNGDEVATQAGAGASHRQEVTKGRSPGGMAFTRTVHRDGAGQATLEQWVLHGAGHAWSGGSPAGSYTDPVGPDASREMVRFFLGHERS